MDAKFNRGRDYLTIWIPKEEWEKIKTERIKTIGVFQLGPLFGKTGVEGKTTIHNPGKQFEVILDRIRKK